MKNGLACCVVASFNNNNNNTDNNISSSGHTSCIICRPGARESLKKKKKIGDEKKNTHMFIYIMYLYYICRPCESIGAARAFGNRAEKKFKRHDERCEKFFFSASDDGATTTFYIKLYVLHTHAHPELRLTRHVLLDVRPCAR